MFLEYPLSWALEPECRILMSMSMCSSRDIVRFPGKRFAVGILAISERPTGCL